MPTTTTTILAKQGNPQTSYDITAQDIGTVAMEGMDKIPEAAPEDTQTVKDLITAVKGLKPSLSGSAWRLNVMLQQLNVRIPQLELTTTTATGASQPVSTTTTVNQNAPIVAQSVTQTYVANFIFTSPAPNTQTNYVYIYAPVVGNPTVATISMVTAFAANMFVDVQVSTDIGQTWRSIFINNVFLTLAASTNFGNPLIDGAFSGIGFTDGSIIRGIMTSSSGTGGSQLSCQVYFS